MHRGVPRVAGEGVQVILGNRLDRAHIWPNVLPPPVVHLVPVNQK